MEGAGDLERVEATCGAFDGFVGRVDFERRFERVFVSDATGETHAFPGGLVGEEERGDGVVVLAGLDGKPGAEEDDVWRRGQRDRRTPVSRPKRGDAKGGRGEDVD